MRSRTIARWGLLAALGAVGLLSPAASAQEYVPTDPPLWTPLYNSRPETGGFFTAAEYLLFHQTRPMDNQLVALRGVIDTNGSLSGRPGTYLGSGARALETDDLGRTTFQPGFSVVLGYKFANGISVAANYRHLFDANYSSAATLAAPYGRFGAQGLETVLVSNVFNFTDKFTGPDEVIPITQTVRGVASGAVLNRSNTFGIWNGAQEMDIRFTQRYTDASILARIPMYETDFYRSYLIAGARTAWLWERFKWRTVKKGVLSDNRISQVFDVLRTTGRPVDPGVALTDPPLVLNGSLQNGSEVIPIPLRPNETLPAPLADEYVVPSPRFIPAVEYRGADFAAIYTNIVSQRMYGPTLGYGCEYYLGHGFAFSADCTGTAYLNVVKTRAKYELDAPPEFGTTQSKRARSLYLLTPQFEGNVSLWWYPIEGVQIRAGYNLLGLFNTISMREPISFNVGAIDPPYNHEVVRILHGLNVAVGLSF